MWGTPLKNMGFNKPGTFTYDILCKLNPELMSFDGMIEIFKIKAIDANLMYIQYCAGCRHDSILK